MSTITARTTRGKGILTKCAAGINKAQLTPEEADSVSGSKRFQKDFVALLKNCALRLPDYTRARSILGNDFITPEEIMNVTEVIYENKHLEDLHNTVPSEDVLHWCKLNNYAIIAAPPYPMSLLDIGALNSKLFYSKSVEWCSRQDFASKIKTTQGWLLIRKSSVPGSFNNSWKAQNNLLSGIESVATSAEMSWLVTTYLQVRRIRLLEDFCVRCSDLYARSFPVTVGDFDSSGLTISYELRDICDYEIGVSSSRKL